MYVWFRGAGRPFSFFWPFARIEARFIYFISAFLCLSSSCDVFHGRRHRAALFVSASLCRPSRVRWERASWRVPNGFHGCFCRRRRWLHLPMEAWRHLTFSKLSSGITSTLSLTLPEAGLYENEKLVEIEDLKYRLNLRNRVSTSVLRLIRIARSCGSENTIMSTLNYNFLLPTRFRTPSWWGRRRGSWCSTLRRRRSRRRRPTQMKTTQHSKRGG